MSPVHEVQTKHSTLQKYGREVPRTPCSLCLYHLLDLRVRLCHTTSQWRDTTAEQHGCCVSVTTVLLLVRGSFEFRKQNKTSRTKHDEDELQNTNHEPLTI